MKPETTSFEQDDNDETIIRQVPVASEEEEDEETMVLPHPDETLILAPNDPLFEGIPASNPFCIRASFLLSLVPKLRVLPSHEDIKALYKQLVKEIQEFESIDPEAGISLKQNQIASYFICALLDETILNTPWGRLYHWGQRTLLQHFHKDGQEGRKFFVLLKQLLQNPKKYVHLVELAYICMSLGYEGVYAEASNGTRVITQHRQKLFDLLNRIKGPDEDYLSTHWQGIQDNRKSLLPQIPLWVSLVIVCVLLLAIYFGVIYLINRDSDRVARHIDHIAQKEKDLRPSAKAARTIADVASAGQGIQEELTPSKNTLTMELLRQGLAHEISQNKAEVLAGPTVRIVNAFSSGSDQVREEFVPLLKKLAKLVEIAEARVLVVGHTDDQPMFSGRFPSNWHLSEARAKSVAARLAISESMAERIRYEGHGASEPIVANDSAQHRALNRRIDILIR